MQELSTFFSYTDHHHRKEKNSLPVDSAEQYNNEKGIFDDKLSVRIVPHVYQPKKTSRIRTPVRRELTVTSKASFNVALDNILFISTLEGCWTRNVHSVAMKKQLSLTEPGECVQHPVPRRYSHPEPDSPLPLSEETRRISIQSDATSCTDLIRRFSSESTQSTQPSSIGSIEEEKRQAPACETHPTQIPVWADPVKIKDNPTRYEQAVCYMDEASIPFDSVLPLPQPCSFYFMDNRQHSYLSSLQSLFNCDTVWNFTNRWQHYHAQTRFPSQLTANQNVACFIQGVEPIWEDPVNRNGGRLNLHLKSHLLDSVFETLLLAFVGGTFLDLGTVGLVLSKRFRCDRIELWLSESLTDQKLADLKHLLQSLLVNNSCSQEIESSQFKKHFM
ncbi:translation initiation factor eIF 4e-like domain-containing protein [Sporodiniella umbellata]|nr:translation initiation factor eIF 4e-like domain-containing protein [Sporodiniella umbellata]